MDYVNDFRTALTNEGKRAFRAALRDRFGARNYRITQTLEIHVHGQMPNSGLVGWYFFGYATDAEMPARLGLEA